MGLIYLKHRRKHFTSGGAALIVQEQNASNRVSGVKPSGVTFKNISVIVDATDANRILVITTSGDAYPISFLRDGSFPSLKTRDTIGNPHASIYYLVNPTSGTYDLRLSGSSGDTIWFGCTTYINVDQSTPFGASKTNTGSAVTSLAISDTVATDDMFVGGISIEDTSHTPGGSQTEIWNGNSIGILGSMSHIQGNGGSTSLSYTFPSSDAAFAGAKLLLA